ncbi:MAG: hypothetical protein V7646_6495 [Pseudonocardia sp.]
MSKRSVGVACDLTAQQDGLTALGVQGQPDLRRSRGELRQAARSKAVDDKERLAHLVERQLQPPEVHFASTVPIRSKSFALAIAWFRPIVGLPVDAHICPCEELGNHLGVASEAKPDTPAGQRLRIATVLAVDSKRD